MIKPTIFLANPDELTLEEVIIRFNRNHEPQEALKLVRDQCLQSDSSDVMKKGLEFLYINGFYEDLPFLIQKNKKSANPSNRQWGEVYEIVHIMLKKHQPHKILQRIDRLKVDGPALRWLIEFIKMTAYLNLNQYNKIGNFLAINQPMLDEINNRLLVSYFKSRSYQILLTYYMMRNELIMARKYAYRLLNQTQNNTTKVNVHIKLGLSYTFESYCQAMVHFREALKLAKQYNMTSHIYGIEQHNIPFISAQFYKVEGITSSDPSEQAHIEIAKGNNDKAIELLSGLDINSPFKLYYVGRAKQDKKILLDSYHAFIRQRSDFFFSRLPFNILKQMDG
ncbi:AimR family lysis-lysogeny pheromone receptor [Lentibacillus sediminis]|uniref:AimR family lysis-lysogeny pheromone receptor n=1 Tax=Lentibacillus sediminis TaxID=1940529 RepID=UPI000C1BF4F4|nr:AimR family lysis-lysogeny pheromone receptor [Lentibacillus sediminis]